METKPEKIIINIMDDIAEIGDWITISDAVQANGQHSHRASCEEVEALLAAIKKSQEVAIGRINGGFRDLPTNWDPADVTAEIFSDPQPVAAMMEVLLRPTGEWPQKRDLDSQ